MDWKMKAIIALFIIFLILLTVFGITFWIANNKALATIFFVVVIVVSVWIIFTRPKQ